MTPYRDEEARAEHDRVATRWFLKSRSAVLLFVFAAAALTAATASLFALKTAIFVAALLPALLFAALAERGVRRIDVGRERIVVRDGYVMRRAVRSLSTTDGAEVRITRAAGTRRVNNRSRAYVAHLVEVHTPHGSWVVFETEDGALANAAADFVTTSLPPRLRVALPEETDLTTAAAAEEELEAAQVSATRRE